MTNIDQFESAFKAASKAVFTYAPVEVRSVLVVTDLADEAEAFAGHARRLLGVLERGMLEGGQTLEFEVVRGSGFRTVGELLEVVERAACDLVCTYRNLHSTAWQWPHSLGVHLDVLTQATGVPVLVLPHPLAGTDLADSIGGTGSVMAITDHLTGDHRLVNYAVALTEPEGRLYLTHVEDEATFDRYIETISKVPTIDTDEAREAILKQLLKEPRDYIRSCREVLGQQGAAVQVEKIVTLGHHLSDYRRLVDEHRVDLLVVNTKDEDQLAMHGLAYPLSVELRSTSILML